MSLPATQEKILRDLRSSIVRFLDTAPDKALIFRASAVLEILKHYFEAHRARIDGDAYDKASAEEVLSGLNFARQRIGSDQDVEKWFAEILAEPTLTDEELSKKAKELEALKARLKAEGIEDW